jgi:transcriptional regulator with XRE-family HTH domain
MILIVTDRTHIILSDFGTVLRALRISKNLSQEQFGHITGLDRTYISGLERGKRNPTLKVLASIAACLNITLSQLLEGIGSSDE